MPVYLSPGVYVEEVPGGPRPIEAVGTNITGFIGLTERGPTRPRLVTNWGDFKRWFGEEIDVNRSYLPYAVRGYFQNDGSAAFVARVVSLDGANPATAATLDLPTQDAAGANLPNNVLRVAVNGPGAWGDRMLVWVRSASMADPGAAPPRDWFRITVLYYRDGIPSPFVDPTNPANLANPLRREPDVLEDFDNLAFAAGRSNNVVAAISRSSKLIEAEYIDTSVVPNVTGTPARPSNQLAADATAAVNLATADADTQLRVTATGPGSWANTHTVTVEPGAQANTFRIIVADGGTEVETFDDLSDANPDQALAQVNSAATRIRLSWNQANPPNPVTPTRPDDTGGPAALGGGADSSSPAGGSDGAAITPVDYAGDPGADPEARTGLAGLAQIDEVSLLVAPDANLPGNFQIMNDVVNQCETLKDRFAILASEPGVGDVQAINPPRDSSYAAVYFPWIRVTDSRAQDTLLVPPVGHVAGIYARTDVARGVHKAPANEVVRGMVNYDINATRRPLEFTISMGGQDILNPKGVNAIRDLRADGRGIRVWGARTMSSDPEWRYINVRRLFLMVEESIDEGTQWVVFEPNEERTWARVRQSVGNFLLTVWRSGALRGITQDEAFFVNCDRTTMTEADIDAGRLICEVGIAPVKPAEFVIFRIQQKTLEQTA